MKTIRNRLLCAGVAVVALACNPKPSQSPEEAVTLAFSEFAEAAGAKNGRKAATLVTEESLVAFDRMRNLALYADATELDKAPIEELTLVLVFRSMLDPGVLRDMSREDLVALALGEEQLLFTRVRKGDTLQDLSIKDEVANARVVVGQNEIHVSDAQLRLEDGVWRYDLLPHLAVMGKNLLDIAKEKNISPGKYVGMLVEARTNTKITGDTLRAPYSKTQHAEKASAPAAAADSL